MSDDWRRRYPVLLVLLAAFYMVATVFALIAAAMLFTGRPVTGLPPMASAPLLAAEAVLFLFFSIGLIKGWRTAWVLALLMNLVWLAMDSSNYILGNLDSPAPIVMAVLSIAVLFTKGVRGHCRMTRADLAGH